MVDTVRIKAATGSTGSGGSTSHGGATSTGASTSKEAAEPYHRLGLPPGASIAEVKKAWRTQSRLAHPDAPGGAAEDFMTLKTAYEKIMEQKKTGPAGQ
jgi:DnaJ-class molecular chaperone